MKLAPLVS